MIITPGCRVLLRVDRREDLDPTFKAAKAAGIITDLDTEDGRRAKAAIDKGTVIAFGPACDPAYVAGLNVGDVIYFAKYAGKIVDDPDGGKFVLVNDEDVVCGVRSSNG